MGVTFIAKEGTYTAPATLTTKTITENGTYSAVDDSANGYSSVTVEVEGGGGSSDFSTAEVTIVGQATIEGALVAVGTESAEFPDETTYGTTDYALQGLNSLTLILYKGSAFITVMGKGDIEVSGNIQPFAQTSNQFIVTGDCTITIS